MANKKNLEKAREYINALSDAVQLRITHTNEASKQSLNWYHVRMTFVLYRERVNIIKDETLTISERAQNCRQLMQDLEQARRVLYTQFSNNRAGSEIDSMAVLMYDYIVVLLNSYMREMDIAGGAP